jgi:hypothetical protein
MGAPGTPTPRGSFWIREKFPVGGGSIYGTRAGPVRPRAYRRGTAAQRAQRGGDKRETTHHLTLFQSSAVSG